jgi:hypothetical protein
MIVTYLLADAGGGTDLVGVNENLPPGVVPADDEHGWHRSIGRLAQLVAADPAGRHEAAAR